MHCRIKFASFVKLRYIFHFTLVNSIANCLLKSVSISMLQKISSCTSLRAPLGNDEKKNKIKQQ